jgi:hypothetical protein
MFWIVLYKLFKDSSIFIFIMKFIKKYITQIYKRRKKGIG